MIGEDELQYNLQELMDNIPLKKCRCSNCFNSNSIIEWYNIIGTEYYVTWFGAYIFCMGSSEYMENGSFHINYKSLEEVLDNSPPEVQTKIIYNLDIFKRGEYFFEEIDP